MQTSKILAVTSVVEVGTGVALMVAPAFVVGLLLGVEVPGDLMALGRVAGVALLALGLACWPGGRGAANGSPAYRAMLIYNALIALYFAYLGAVAHQGGMLLWPAAVVHAAVAVLLIGTARSERPAR